LDEQNECCVCEKPFQVAASAYQTRIVPQWCGLTICKHCERSNRNGIDLHSHPHLVRNLQILRIKLVPNEHGRMPLPSIGIRRQTTNPEQTGSPLQYRDNVVPLRKTAA
jgi:hypothetical protein